MQAFESIIRFLAPGCCVILTFKNFLSNVYHETVKHQDKAAINEARRKRKLLKQERKRKAKQAKTETKPKKKKEKTPPTTKKVEKKSAEKGCDSRTSLSPPMAAAVHVRRPKYTLSCTASNNVQELFCCAMIEFRTENSLGILPPVKATSIASFDGQWTTRAYCGIPVSHATNMIEFFIPQKSNC